MAAADGRRLASGGVKRGCRREDLRGSAPHHDDNNHAPRPLRIRALAHCRVFSLPRLASPLAPGRGADFHALWARSGNPARPCAYLPRPLCIPSYAYLLMHPCAPVLCILKFTQPHAYLLCILLVHTAYMHTILCTLLVHPYATLGSSCIYFMHPSAPLLCNLMQPWDPHAYLLCILLHPSCASYATSCISLMHPSHAPRFGNPARPPPPPAGPCPGGALSACIALCPASPPKAYTDCVEECGRRCPPPAGAAAG